MNHVIWNKDFTLIKRNTLCKFRLIKQHDVRETKKEVEFTYNGKVTRYPQNEIYCVLETFRYYQRIK